MVNVYLQDSLISGNLIVEKAVKKIPVVLNKGENIIAIEAINEGSIPPNSTNIIVKADNLDTPVSVRLLKDKKAQIKVIY